LLRLSGVKLRQLFNEEPYFNMLQLLIALRERLFHHAFGDETFSNVAAGQALAYLKIR
jgi:hypothetical protein